MAQMKVLAPKMEKLKQLYGDDRQKLNQAMMEMYRTEKINPLGGCLPIVVQIPVFIALYWVLLASIELRHAPWIGWIQDLSAPDPYFILPVIYAISMFVQTRLNPAAADPMQAKIMLIMPIMFSVFFLFFPAGPGALLGGPEPAVDRCSSGTSTARSRPKRRRKPGADAARRDDRRRSPPRRAAAGSASCASRAPARARSRRASLGDVPAPRHATLAAFRGADGRDRSTRASRSSSPAPHSYTGEDVLELQGHGGPVVMQLLLRRCLELGARIAEPGEFTRRAFLNDRSTSPRPRASPTSSTRRAPRRRAARRDRSPASSPRAFTDSWPRLVELRVHVEACIDFPEEEIDPADRRWQHGKLAASCATRSTHVARRGAAGRGAARRAHRRARRARRTSASRACSTGWRAKSSRSSRRFAGTTRDYVRATIDPRGRADPPRRHRGPARDRRRGRAHRGRAEPGRRWQRAGAALVRRGRRGPGAGGRGAARRDCPPGLPVARVVNKIDLSGQAPGRHASERRPAHLGCRPRPARASTGCGGGSSRSQDGARTARAYSWPASGTCRPCEAAAAALEARLAAQAFELKAEELAAGAAWHWARSPGEVHRGRPCWGRSSAASASASDVPRETCRRAGDLRHLFHVEQEPWPSRPVRFP